MDQYLEEIVKKQEVENKDDLRKILEKLVEATEKKKVNRIYNTSQKNLF